MDAAKSGCERPNRLTLEDNRISFPDFSVFAAVEMKVKFHAQCRRIADIFMPIDADSQSDVIPSDTVLPIRLYMVMDSDQHGLVQLVKLQEISS